jgi:hypothetical protein
MVKGIYTSDIKYTV